MTSYVKFEVKRNEWITRVKDPDDGWSHDSTDATVEIVQAALVNDDGYDILGIDKELNIGDICFLIWAQYSTGDSFGVYGGQYTLLEITTDRDDATARAKHYKEIKDYSVPWNGYFERLDFIEVTSFTLGDETIKMRF